MRLGTLRVFVKSPTAVAIVESVLEKLFPSDEAFLKSVATLEGKEVSFFCVQYIDKMI